MSDIFIEPTAAAAEKPKTSRRKTKKEMDNEEYMRVCERMAKLREMRKGDKPKAEKPVKEKEVIKYVDRPVEVVKEVIKEVVKEVPAPAPAPVKTKQYKEDLFGDTDELKNDLKEVKTILAEMRKAKLEKAEKKKQVAEIPEPVKQAEPAKQPEPVKQPEPIKQPESTKMTTKLLYTGPMGMFRPF